MNKISIQDGKLIIPDNSTIPFIRWDGKEPDIEAASLRVCEAALKIAYTFKRSPAYSPKAENIFWFEMSTDNKRKNDAPEVTRIPSWLVFWLAKIVENYRLSFTSALLLC